MPDNASEAARLREVHKYYDVQQREIPHASGANCQRSSNLNDRNALPDTALTAFLQLVTLRLDVQRAVVSLLDKDDQHFLAESKKTRDLVDPSIYEVDGGQSWMGCSSPILHGATLCTYTINACSVADHHPSFFIKDLQSDSRFKNLPFVEGPPHFRFYAGTPLISKDGYRIGSLFVVDDRVRDSVTDNDLDFLGVMAENVMKYMELEAESQEQKRHMTMSKGLAALVEGKSRIPSEWLDQSTLDTGTTKPHADHIDSISWDGELDQKLSTSDPSSSSNYDESELYKGVYARSVNLLRESLDVDYTVFTETGKDNRIGITSGGVNVVGFSSSDHSTVIDNDHGFDCHMEQDFLKTLFEKYPMGKIWSYHEDGSCEFDDEMPMSLDSKDSSPKSAQGSLSERAEDESQALLKCFPNARQILYAPLYYGDSRNPDYFSACFAVSNHEIPVFTTNIEVAFVRAFVNSMGVICGHLSAALSDKQKSEFISSMSHELRSPLHGILASTELLYGTLLDPNQKDLCETVDVCGQTLLDTLSQILDYSKVNNFLRSKSKSDTKPSGTADQASRIHAGSSLHVYSECDVATLCEEALDVVNMSFAQLLATKGPSPTPTIAFGTGSTELNDTIREPVMVDFTAPNYDWTFLCSPGAIRRIVMNLVGNSFKYTSSGSISIMLDLMEPGTTRKSTEQQSPKDFIIIIKVTDTGKGMSENFMKNRLFVPFSQESSSAPGSGLGLSLVQGIIKSLDGKIEISSTAGKGTTIEVSLPVKRSPVHITKPHSFEVLRPPSQSDSMISKDQRYSILGARKSFHEKVRPSLQYYMKNWLSMDEIEPSNTSTFTFIDEIDLQSFLAGYSASDKVRYGLVLSRGLIVPDVRTYQKTKLNLEPLRIPFGPRKLLKALRACVDQPAHQSKEPNSTKELQQAIGKTPPGIPISQADDKSSAKILDVLSRPTISSRQQPKHQSALPLSATTILTDRPAQPPRSASHPEPSQGAKSSRILCVDDNSINLKLLQTFARKLGFNVIETAEDGLQALTAAERCAQENNGAGGFDVIFMDLTMPVMDGFESTKKIRALEEERKKNFTGPDGTGVIPRRAIIVALTGLASEQDQRKAFAAGVDHFVTKPLRFKDLKSMLGDWDIMSG